LRLSEYRWNSIFLGYLNCPSSYCSLFAFFLLSESTFYIWSLFHLNCQARIFLLQIGQIRRCLLPSLSLVCLLVCLRSKCVLVIYIAVFALRTEVSLACMSETSCMGMVSKFLNRSCAACGRNVSGIVCGPRLGGQIRRALFARAFSRPDIIGISARTILRKRSGLRTLVEHRLIWMLLNWLATLCVRSVPIVGLRQIPVFTLSVGLRLIFVFSLLVRRRRRSVIECALIRVMLLQLGVPVQSGVPLFGVQ